MVAIFTGVGAGFDRGSASVLGGSGILGSAAQGRGGEGVHVNAATGNLVLTRQDEFLVGRGPDVGIARTYNGLGSVPDENGDRWRFAYDRRVFGLTGTQNAAGSTIKRLSGDGSEIVYSWDATRAAYVARDGGGSYDQLVKSGADWIWTDGNSRITERYVAYGTTNGTPSFRIVAQTDTDGNALAFTYSADRLTRIATADGSYADYVWSGTNVAQLTTGYTDLVTGTARTLVRTRYGYDGANRLVTVTTDRTPNDSSVGDGNAYVTTYGYDGAGRVATITQSDGSALTITYDGSNRVASLVQTVASGVTRTTSLSYGAGTTAITDATGQVTSLNYDAAGNLTRITAPAAFAGAAQQIVQFGYNANGDLATVTDAFNNVTSHGYDANGNAVSTTDRLGNVVTRTYGAKNELLTETRTGSDASGAAVGLTTRYAYDAENHLRYVVSAEGRVTEYRYHTTGELLWTVEYPEHSYAIGSGALSEATLDAWRNALVDKQSNQFTYHAYDARGNLTQTVNYGYTDSVGNPIVSEGYTHSYFTYDQAGRLLSRVAATQNTETFVYDGLGRLTASTDLNGGTTSFVFNDAATTTTVTLASGYVTTNTYNKAGDLVATTDSGSYVAGGTTANAYDRLGRLRVATDATGIKSYIVYDKAGQKVADVNHYGDVVEYRYDANGRLVATARYALRLTAAQLATLDNPDAVFDFASLRPAAHSYDVWAWSVYDKEGRVTAAIGGDGAVTTYSYDASGRLVLTRGYANKLSAATIAGYRTTAPATVTLPAADAARDGIARTFYDRDGMMIGVLDGEGYLTRSVYDKAGQLVEQTGYINATGSAGAVDRATASFNQLVASIAASAENRVVRHAYDGQGYKRFSIDALGYVTEYVYESDVKWGAIGLVRGTIQHAVAIATGDFTYDSVKALVAPQAGNAANRQSWAIYDAAGRVAYAIGAEGAVTGFTYDIMGQVTRAVEFAATRPTTALPSEATMNAWRDANIGNAANRITRTWYTARGEARYTVDAEGYVSRTDYDAAGRTAAIYRWDNKITVGDGTTIGQVNSLSDASGTYVGRSFAYRPGGQLYIDYDAYGVMTLYDYYATGQLAARYDAYGTADQAVTYYVYDQAGRLMHEYGAYGTPEQSLTQYSYDGLGNVTAVIDPRGLTTSFTYDRNGNVKTQTNAIGGVSSFEYNAFGEAWKVTDPRGNASYNWYDRLGRITHSRDAEDYLTQTSYTIFGEIASVTRRFAKVTGTPAIASPPAVAANASEDATTSFIYDKLGRAIRSTDALGFFETFTYNAFGNRISQTAKSSTTSAVTGATSSYSYDRRGQLLTETLPMTTYDQWGNLTSSTVVNRFEYDARGNRTKAVDADNLGYRRTTTYIYDKNNRLTETRRDAINVIADDLVSVSNTVPTERIKYDARGNVVETVDAGGARALFYFDDANRVVAEIRQTSASANTYSTHGYDAVGNRIWTRVYTNAVVLPGTAGGTAPAAPGGGYRETSFAYDNLNRLASSTVASVYTGTYGSGYGWANLVTAYEYDAAGNVVRLTDPNGGQTFSYYDKLGNKIAQIDTEGYLTRWAFDPDGNVTTETRYATRFTGTPTTATIPTVGTSGDDRITNFGYDRVGNRTSEQRVGVIAHSVNASNGALAAAGTTATVSYLYNGLGQVVQKTEATGELTSYAYDGAGRLSSETRAAFVDFNGQWVAPSTSYLYDGLGNLSRTTKAGATNAPARVTTYSYDIGGRLVSTTDATGFTRTYAHDAMGRVKKESYVRLNSTGGSVTDAIATRYDLAGRAIYNGVTSWNGSSFVTLDYSQTEYTNFGEVSRTGSNGLFQVQNQYDNAGRLSATNAADGSWRYFGYDRNGNQTIAISSAGANLAGQSFAGALALVGQANVNGSYTVYDKRNMAVQVVEEGRQLTTTTVQSLVSSRAYNAFGEVASETNAANATLNYTYNTMGRVIRTESPWVSITLENGSQQTVRPTEQAYYDLGGRLVGNRDANNNLHTRSLLAGTGYGGGNGIVVTAFAADGGKVTNSYDVHGDARRVTDQLGRVTTNSYDAAGRLTQTSRFGGLVENYGFDGLGRQIWQSNNQFQTPIYGPPEQVWVEDPPYWNPYDQAWEYGGGHYETHYPIIGYEGEKARTDYDALGRVTSQVGFGGDVTTTAYVWNGALATGALGTLGGWRETVTYANGRTSIVSSDIYGRELSKTDLGGHIFTSGYDAAGRATNRNAQNFTYYNTGLLAESYTQTGDVASQNWSRNSTRYGYDAVGNRITEIQSLDGEESYQYWHNPYEPDWYYNSYSYQYQNITATYDALGRLKTFNEAGTGGTAPPASISYEYDAAGNVRRTYATYRTLDHQGTASSYATTRDYWFRYDSMNRLVTDKGALRNGTIVRGEATWGGPGGQDIHYNLAGERVAVLRTEYVSGWWDYYGDPYDPYGGYYESYYNPGYYYETRESYVYNSAGRVGEIQVSQGGAAYENYDPNTGVSTPPTSIPAAPTAGTRRSSFVYDLLGRQTSQADYEANGATVAFSRSAVYNNKGQLTSDYTVTKKTDNYTYQSSTTYDYGYGTNYALGSAVSVSSKNYRNNNDSQAPDTLTTNAYQWWDGAVQSSISYKPNTAQSTTYTTSFYYDGFGQLSSIYVSDGRPRSITFRLNAEGQIIRRDEQDNNYSNGDPHEVWYRFNGRELGYTGNNGTSDVNTSSSIATRQQAGPTGTPGPFRGGATYGSSYADFANSYNPINSFSQGSAGGSYTVRAGDTLASIARNIYGDAGLWYKIAESNGLSGEAALSEGRSLILPAGVLRSAHNANTLKPYNAAEAIGDVSPSAPQPPKKNKCGTFGIILLAVIAIAVTVVTAGAAAAALAPSIGSVGAGISAVLGGTLATTAGIGIGGAIAIGAGSAALGSIVSQGIGVATGIQEKFSWKGVALAAIGGGVGAGIGGSGIFEGIKNGALRAGVSAAASSAVTQGIGVLTGLQDKFSWAGVAGAGLGAAAGYGAGKLFGAKSFVDIKDASGAVVTPGDVSLGNHLAHLGTSAASTLANAATRSALEGTNFGANIRAALPDIIGQALGNLIAVGLASAPGRVIANTPVEVPALTAGEDMRARLTAPQIAELERDYVLEATPEGLIATRRPRVSVEGGGTEAPQPKLHTGVDGSIIPDANGYFFLDTAPAEWQNKGRATPLVDSGGINFYFDGGATGFNSEWYGFDGGGATRLLTAGGRTFVWAGGDAYIPGLGVSIRSGERSPPIIITPAAAPDAGSSTGSTASDGGPSLASQGVSLVLDFIPVIGTIKSGLQLITGRDIITGERINRWEEAAGLGLSLVGAKGLTRLDDTVRFGRRAFNAADDITTGRRAVDGIGESRIVGDFGGCFVAGTLVHTQDGVIPIEAVRIGMMVLSQPEDGGATGFRRVNDVFRFDDKPIWQVSYQLSNGSVETQHATPDHPYWVKNVGWTGVEFLAVGQTLVLADGSEAVVAVAVDTGEVGTVHNFEVDGWHTYYVGETGVWVHNNNCGAPLIPGEGGRFGDLNGRRVTGDDLTPHHIPQDGLHFTSRADGGAIMMTTAEHGATRTFGAAGRATKAADAGRSFRDVLAADIRDVRSIVGSQYNNGLREVIQYYRSSQPTLMARPPR